MKNKIKVVKNENINYYNLEGNLIECIAQLQAELDGIPEEHRAEAQISIELSDSYGSPSCDIEVYYWRDESDAEYQARLEEQARADEQRKAYKMANYLKLQKELGL